MHTPRFVRGSLLLLAASMPVHAALYWDGTSTTPDADGGVGTWDTTATNWDSAAVAGTDVVWNPAETAAFGGTAGTVTIATGGITAANLDFQVTGYNVSGDPIALSNGNVRVGSGSATVGSVITGSNGLTKTGSGAIILAGNNTYTGTTTVSGGILVANVLANNVTASSLGIGTSLVLDGGTFRYPTASANVNNFARLITLAGDSVVDMEGAGFLFFGGVISGPGSLTKVGTRQLIISGNNTYQGETFVNVGEVQIRNLNAFGTTGQGTTVADGARVAAGGALGGTVNERFTLNGLGGGNGALQANDSGTNVTFGGAITLATTSGIGGGVPFAISGVIGGPGGLTKLTTNAVTLNGTAANTYTGVTTLGGTGKLVLDKTDGVVAIPGNINLSSTAWNGQNSGVVLASNEQIADTSIVTWTTTSAPAGGAQEDSFLRLNGYTETIGGLVSTGLGFKAVVENRGANDLATYGQGTLIINVATGLTHNYNGSMRDSDGGDSGTGGKVALTKTGPGTQVLSGGMNSATGPLLVNAGTLRVNNLLGSATSSVTGTGTLEGTGTMSGGAVTVTAGGTLAPGITGTGTFTVTTPAVIGNLGKLSLATATLGGSATVASGGLVTGAGTVSGSLTVQSGGTLTPGTDLAPIGTISVNGALNLAGTTNIQIGKTGGVVSNDSIAGPTSIAFGGTLAISVVAGSEAFTVGDTITLFNSPGALFSGSFASITGLPALGTGLQWETTNLTSNGTISVVSNTSAPGFSLSSGGYIGAQSVTISSDPGATIYYTTNGSTPTVSSPSGLSPLTGITVPDNTVGFTIKAMAKHPDFGFSAVSTATYNTVSGSAKWNVDANGNWSDAGNWLNQVVPNGTGVQADFTFTQGFPTLVTVDSNRTVGGLLFNNANAISWTLEGSSVLTLDVATGSPVIATPNVAVETFISTVLGGNKGFTKTGAGLLTLSGANSYAGDTVISGGVVSVANLKYNGTASPLGTGSNLVLDGGTLRYTGGSVRVDQVSNFNRNVVLTANNGTIETGAAGFWLAEGVFSGAGGFTKTGAKQLILVNAGSYGGVTNVNEGEIQFRTQTSLGAATAGTNVANGAWVAAGGNVNGAVAEPFTLNGTGNGNGALQGNDASTVNFTGPVTLATTAGVGGSRDFTLSGGVSGPGGLTKLSGNNITVTGALTYQGPTTVSAGTLGISGTTTSGLTVATGATFAPGGAIIGTFIAGNTDINGTYAFQATETTADNLTVNGNLDIEGATLAYSQLIAPTANSYVIASYTGTLTGTFTVTGTLPSGYSVVYDATAKQILLRKSGGFSSWASTNGLTGSPTADFDNDGLPDAVEYVLGSDPKASSTAAAPALSLSGANMVFTFNRANSSKTADVTVAIEVGTNLTAWPTTYTVGNDTAGSTAGVTVTAGANADTVTLTVPRGTDTKKFARLKVTVAP
ncbi:autotransporter-associated beta strand repeat-containing protein [Luteolibacter flavescens]|uniref:Autotransporter-associated beta strand repeat-containing protein n=1 Tax=Luteolibacter flavescens TaxID=1859460 RepID=A0ABT3FRQ4_9BACT|nr:autotransporter-associated beta strand repeat-containing protein [Luteolibacter flavescens]MCW1886273.1 autotransporter-associated beta strand repeat-containing protein [Luteolibacter flavescens]